MISLVICLKFHSTGWLHFLLPSYITVMALRKCKRNPLWRFKLVKLLHCVRNLLWMIVLIILSGIIVLNWNKHDKSAHASETTDLSTLTRIWRESHAFTSVLTLTRTPKEISYQLLHILSFYHKGNETTNNKIYSSS